MKASEKMIRTFCVISPIQFLAILLFAVSYTAVEISPTILQVSDGKVVLMSLSSYNTSDEENQAFTQLVTIDKSVGFEIQVNDIPAEVAFVIVQIHSYLYNTSMSYAKTFQKKESGNVVVGTNIGLFVETDKLQSVSVYATNDNDFQIGSLIAVVAYKHVAPYPGGCNMEFEVERSPFQKLSYDNATVTVDAQPASVPKIGAFEPLCEKYPLRHDAYRMYMPEQDFSNETYFSAVAKMLTVRDIQRNANFIPQTLYGSAMRRVYSLYPGTGSVYGMVARFTNHSSAYVPIVTYGCDPTRTDSCTNLTTPFAKVLCALSFFLGLLVSMRGYYYFKISMFLVGMALGGYIGYVTGSAMNTFSIEGTIMTAIVFGVLTSLIWLLLWLTLSSPLPSLILSSLTLGSFFFYIFYFTIPAGVLYLELNSYYWLLFISFIVVSFLTFSLMPLVGNILCFTLIGAFATVVSIDFYGSSNLKYLIINGIRRVTASNFNLAVVTPPYQDKDILLTFFWVFLVIMGLYKQCATSWNRAPFPPSPSTYANSVDEHAPLLGGRRYRIRQKSIYNGSHYQRYDF